MNQHTRETMAADFVVGLMLVGGTILFSVGLIWLVATVAHGAGH